MSVEQLNENQRAIYQYVHVERHTVEQAAQHFGSTPGLIQAQVTRCRTKGVTMDVPGETQPAAKTRHSGRPAESSSTRTSNERVLDTAQQAGTPEYSIEKIVEEAQSQPGFHDMMNEVHPMILMGCAIQFMKLCGGRFHAHQAIEDVYSAVRLQVGEREIPGVTQETKPFNQPIAESGSPLAMMENMVEQMRQNPAFAQAEQPGQPIPMSQASSFTGSAFDEE
jgi:hypothetical protein